MGSGRGAEARARWASGQPDHEVRPIGCRKRGSNLSASAGIVSRPTADGHPDFSSQREHDQTATGDLAFREGERGETLVGPLIPGPDAHQRAEARVLSHLLVVLVNDVVGKDPLIAKVVAMRGVRGAWLGLRSRVGDLRPEQPDGSSRGRGWGWHHRPPWSKCRVRRVGSTLRSARENEQAASLRIASRYYVGLPAPVARR